MAQRHFAGRVQDRGSGKGPPGRIARQGRAQRHGRPARGATGQDLFPGARCQSGGGGQAERTEAGIRRHRGARVRRRREEGISMYVPKLNQMEDRAALLGYMRTYSFAALASAGPAGLMATHLPFVVEEHDGRITLLAHMAKANPQWRDFAAGADAMAIFMQPHAYVSPRLYDRRQN